MFPRLFTLPSFDLFGRTIGPLTLHSYGVLLALAFWPACGWSAANQEGKPRLDLVTDMAVYVLIGG